MYQILCFGDSNTYGYRPDGGGRYRETIRWTGILQKQLGGDYRVVDEGLCGRTTIFDNDVNPGRCGLEHIGMLVESHAPIDWLVIMLGTNDFKTRYQASAEMIVDGVFQCIDRALTKTAGIPHILVMAPILLGEGVDVTDPAYDAASVEKSRSFGSLLSQAATERGYHFLDASRYASSGADHEHMDEDSHRALADAVSHFISLHQKI